MSAWTQFIVTVSLFVSVHCGDATAVYKQNANTRYTNISQTVSAGSSLSCGRLCYNVGCKVFNYDPVALMCELGSLVPGDEVKTDMKIGWQMYLYAVNECESSPCHNSGTCTDYIGYYECSCLDGWGGTNCDAVTGCISEWQRFQKSCYHFTKIDQERDDAQTRCSVLIPNAHLVDIKSQDEHDFVAGYANASSTMAQVWIGATYNVSSGEYVWTDGESMVDGFTSWGNQEPTDTNEHCVMLATFINGGYMWADNSCGAPLSSMCEYEIP